MKSVCINHETPVGCALSAKYYRRHVDNPACDAETAGCPSIGARSHVLRIPQRISRGRRFGLKCRSRTRTCVSILMSGGGYAGLASGACLATFRTEATVVETDAARFSAPPPRRHADLPTRSENPVQEHVRAGRVAGGVTAGVRVRRLASSPSTPFPTPSWQ
jgi:hypothetical protein